jgi:hypothetical protein
MKTAAVTGTLTQLTRLRLVNAYLVREDDGFTLVDTTLKGQADALIQAARALGGDIRRIALTHGHGDHVGSLDQLKERLGDSVEVLMPELDARIHAGEKVVEGKLPGGWPTLTTVPDVRLSGGDRVGSLEVVTNPGHNPRPRGVRRHARSHPHRRRHVHDGRPSRGHRPLQRALPARRDGDLGRGEDARVGARAAGPRPGGPGGRPWAGAARAGGGDGRGDRSLG